MGYTYWIVLRIRYSTVPSVMQDLRVRCLYRACALPYTSSDYEFSIQYRGCADHTSMPVTKAPSILWMALVDYTPCQRHPTSVQYRYRRNIGGRKEIRSAHGHHILACVMMGIAFGMTRINSAGALLG